MDASRHLGVESAQVGHGVSHFMPVDAALPLSCPGNASDCTSLRMCFSISTETHTWKRKLVYIYMYIYMYILFDLFIRSFIYDLNINCIYIHYLSIYLSILLCVCVRILVCSFHLYVKLSKEFTAGGVLGLATVGLMHVGLVLSAIRSLNSAAGLFRCPNIITNTNPKRNCTKGPDVNYVEFLRPWSLMIWQLIGVSADWGDGYL